MKVYIATATRYFTLGFILNAIDAHYFNIDVLTIQTWTHGVRL